MTTQTYLIYGVMCLLCFLYYIYTSKKAKAIADNFNKESVKNNLNTHVTQIVNSRVPYLKKWIKDKPIDAFTDASISVSLKDKAKNAAIDTLKSVAWRAVGVKATYNRVDAVAHLVLSNDELIFVSANMDGDLDTHIVFSNDQLINAKIEYKGSKKGTSLASGVSDLISSKVNSEEKLVNVFAITLMHNKQSISIQAHDKIVLDYTMMNGNFTKDSLTANLIADNFFTTLSAKYPNLKATKTTLIN